MLKVNNKDTLTTTLAFLLLTLSKIPAGVVIRFIEDLENV